jgi:hypothetical protein
MTSIRPQLPKLHLSLIIHVLPIISTRASDLTQPAQHSTQNPPGRTLTPRSNFENPKSPHPKPPPPPGITGSHAHDRSYSAPYADKTKTRTPGQGHARYADDLGALTTRTKFGLSTQKRERAQEALDAPSDGSAGIDP